MKKTATCSIFGDIEEMDLEVLDQQDQNFQQLEKIRRLSNIIQALENVVIQCADFEAVGPIRNCAELSLSSLQQQLRHEIHHSGNELVDGSS